MRYEKFRREYMAGGLARETLDACPVKQFEIWLEQAVEAGIQDPTAMVLATVGEHHALWQRIVLLKGISDGGFVFYTNLDSDKARAIERQPDVSLLFPWHALDRQVIVGGKAERMSVAQAARYFLTRPRESQVAAWASRQSRRMDSRALLEQQAHKIRQRFADGEIPMPDFWGGYRVIPRCIEFWQGREHRLHDRFRYRRGEGDSWEIEQLQP
jgi:pyridoxamine 5'-phosphate oxidase